MEIEKINLHKDLNEGVITYDGMDECIIGIDVFTAKFVYSFEKITKLLSADGMDPEDAVEFVMYNFDIAGEDRPIICDGLSQD